MADGLFGKNPPFPATHEKMHSLSHFAPIQKPPVAIIHQDEALIVVNKPAGLLVHRSPVDRHAHAFLLQTLRDQIGQRLYPVHRLDRPTSGIMVFACNAQAARQLATQFENQQVRKTYLALVRGWPASQGIDYPLQTLDALTAKKSGAAQAAHSRLRLLRRYELPLANSRYPSSRYSLVALRPESGRRHQLRRHLKHIFHPILGDTTYGDLKQNRAFAAYCGVNRLWLHAYALTLRHPDGQIRHYRAAPDGEWQSVFHVLSENSYFLP